MSLLRQHNNRPGLCRVDINRYRPRSVWSLDKNLPPLLILSQAEEVSLLMNLEIHLPPLSECIRKGKARAKCPRQNVSS